MVKWTAALALCLLLSGCAPSREQPVSQTRIPDMTPGQIYVPAFMTTESGRILERLWQRWDAGAAVPVGQITEGVLPGGCCVSPQVRKQIREGAAVSHILGSTLFSATVLTLAREASCREVLTLWRRAFHRRQWPGETPQWLVLLELDPGHIMAVTGKMSTGEDFVRSALEAFSRGKVWFREIIG